MKRTRLAITALAALAACAFAAAPAAAAPTWAPASSAPIHPGVQTFTDGAQCTANFVYYDASNVYIGQAAHCSGTGSSTVHRRLHAASRCRRARPSTSPAPASPGPWSTTRGSGCRRTARRTPTPAPTTTSRSSSSTRPTPRRSTPRSRSGAGRTGIDTDGTQLKDQVESYGNSELRGGVTQLSPKDGYSLGDDGNGWSHTVYTATPGIPGDSGSAFLNDQGQALGILSTVAIAPVTGSNGVGDVNKELNYANSHGVSVTLADGTEAFTGGLLP